VFIEGLSWLQISRRQFRGIADMSDAEQEIWLFPYVVKLAKTAKGPE
jgi:hypothetical protein